MIKSMTGYGKGEDNSERGRFVVEIRSVNHRYGEVSLRLPRQYMASEIDVKRTISNTLKRGKIDVSIQWEEASSAGSLPQINHELAKGYFQALGDLSRELGLTQEIPLSLILAQKGVFSDPVIATVDEELIPNLFNAVQSAISAIESMRSREGEALTTDLLARRTQIAEWIEDIRQNSTTMVAEYQKKLTARLEQLLGEVKPDPDRLAQEVALLADRCDITEEIVRLSSHFTQFDETLGHAEPVGRKLDFLMQEMNREVNTIGSKANDSTIAMLVIRIKAELEKMREQVQNIE